MSARAWIHALWLCAVTLGCTGARTGERDTSDPSRARVLATSELPPRQREVWEAWQRGGGRWELERENVKRDPELAQFLVENLVRALVKSYDRSAIASAGQKSGPFERAANELVEFRERAIPILVELVGVRDGIVAFLAADILARIGVDAARPTSALLADATAETRRRAAELLSKLPQAGDDEIGIQEALARCVEHDGEWIVRAEAARALGARGARHEHKGFALGVLGRALRDKDPTVVASACQGLVTLNERRAVPALVRELRPASQRGDFKALQALQSALRLITGMPRDLTPEEWSSWYEAHPPPPGPPVKTLPGQRAD